MYKAVVPFAAAFLALGLAACEEAPPEPLPDEVAADTAPASPTAPGATAPGVPGSPGAATEDIEPVMVAADAVAVGSALGPGGEATAPKPVYALSDVIHASAHGTGEAKVYWSYQDGSSHKEETKPANGLVAFQFSKADGMRVGNYMVSIDIDGVPVGITEFVVK